MRKLRSDSTSNGLSAGQREKLLNWLFNDNISYAAAVERVKKEFGVATSLWSVRRFYRHAAEERKCGEPGAGAGERDGLSHGHSQAIRRGNVECLHPQ